MEELKKKKKREKKSKKIKEKETQKKSPVVQTGDIFAVGLQSRSFSALANSITQISKGTKEIP